MKNARLICMIVLMGAVAIGCGLEEAGSAATNGTGATGGSGNAGGGTGATGGTPMGACTTPENEAVYDDLDYTNRANEMVTGTEAAADIAGDCLRIEPPTGCQDQTAIIISMLPTPGQEAIDNLAACDVMCLSTTVVDLTGGEDLSAECLDCYGETVACGAAWCTGPCAADTNAPGCITCRCGDNTAGVNCIGEFVTCSGIPSSDCN